jgi:hypothetical protein
MTIDRAIEILDPEHRENYDGMDEVNEACRMGMEALERTRWIPCSERLPEDSVKKVHVFVPHCHGDIVDVGRYLGADGWVLEGWHLPQCAVTHWMPLPEPPEEVLP